MDVQVQELIDKIKRDGIESASAQASGVLSDAQAQARNIVESARREAAELVAQGKRDVERMEKASIAAVEQASRNLVLAFRAEIEVFLAALVRSETAKALDADLLKGLIPDLITSWASKGTDSIDLLLPPEALSSLEAFFKEKLAAELRKGTELKPSRGLTAGFRIAVKDGSAYFDFSADAVADLLSAYLNTRLAGTLKNAVKGM